HSITHSLLFHLSLLYSLPIFSFLLANDQFFEIIHRVQVGVRGQVDLKQRAFRVADGREKIISRKHVAHLGWTDVERRHSVRLHPERKSTSLNSSQQIIYYYVT